MGMLISRSAKRQKGFMSLDTAIAIAVAVAFAAYVLGKAEPLKRKGDEQLLVDNVTHIIDGARNEAAGTLDGYASITISTLSNKGMVPESWGDGSGVNPSGGGYALTGSDETTLIVIADSLDQDVCDNAASKFALYTTATCSSGTLTVTTI